MYLQYKVPVDELSLNDLGWIKMLDWLSGLHKHHKSLQVRLGRAKIAKTALHSHP